MRYTTISLLLLIAPLESMGQTSASDAAPIPRWQVEFNASGTFLKVLANTLANEEVDDLSVGNWIVPGVSVAYHFSDRLALSYAFQPSRSLILKEAYGFGAVPDGSLTVQHATGSMHDLELRVTPIRKGPYVSIGLSHTPQVAYDLTMIRREATLDIGGTEVASDLEADWNFRALTALIAGLGYQYAHSSGWTGRLGVAVPIAAGPHHEDISVRATEPGVDLDAASQDRITRQLEDETFYLPVRLTLSIGRMF